MTTELEEQFFKTFGIEKNNNNCPMLDKNNCVFVPSECNYYQYPEITDRKLLEMICICNSTYINGYTNYFMATGKTKEELKEEILKKCITLSKDINNKIQQLFKEKK